MSLNTFLIVIALWTVFFAGYRLVDYLFEDVAHEEVHMLPQGDSSVLVVSLMLKSPRWKHGKTLAKVTYGGDTLTITGSDAIIDTATMVYRK